jgi:glycosyltransferase involved in cell wall biosynthesis
LTLDQTELEVQTAEKRKPLASIVVTLYNEAENVEPMTRNLVSTFRNVCNSEPFELVLVLNGSQDQTPEKARELAAEFPEVILVSLKTNQGYGGGVRAGLAAASGELIGYTDADEQIYAEETAKVYSAALAGNYDLVKAVRTVRQDGWKRFVVTTIYNLLFRFMFGITRKDINAKPKVFKRHVLERLKLTSSDWFIDAKVMIQAKQLKLSVAEVPIFFRARARGNSNVRLSTIMEFLVNMWKYRKEQGVTSKEQRK